MRRRVVITGIGMVSPLGQSCEETWKNLKAGKSGIDRISLFDASTFPTQIAGEVKQFDLSKHLSNSERWKQCGRHIHFALVAADQAAKDAGLHDQHFNPRRTGVYLGAGEGKLDADNFVTMINRAWNAEDRTVDTAAFIDRSLNVFNGMREFEQEPGRSSTHVADLLDARGPNMNCLTACAASSQAIGEATEIIRHGDADVMISGGTHSMIHLFGVTGFNLLTALSTSNAKPQEASRPFDKGRDGFVIGEGAGMVILEELEHARNAARRFMARSPVSAPRLMLSASRTRILKDVAQSHVSRWHLTMPRFR